ncbi:MAG: hypothetical protein ACI94Y_002502 [Maribacter sp.]|jgi:hypothetical protein
MNFFKRIFGKKDKKINSYEDFWKWFQKYEKDFFKIVKNHIKSRESSTNIETDFFDKLSPKLKELRDGFFFLAGMPDDNTVELIMTPDGNIRNIVFIEQLIKAAPSINGWIFTALKPASDISDFELEMANYKFNKDNLFFYSTEYDDYPDEIEITIVYEDFNEKDKAGIINGIYIFLDNYLGELDFITSIDTLEIAEEEEIEKELIPIEKLKSFLKWRKKEFVEKYEGLRHDTENDDYAGLEGKLKNGQPFIAVINSTLMNWGSKASHPWILNIEIKYDGDEDNGMPDDNTYQLLSDLEEEIMIELKDADGYLNIARQTAENSRDIYFACNDFRKPSYVLSQLINTYQDKLDISYSIYKDKYWRSFECFIR